MQTLAKTIALILLCCSTASAETPAKLVQQLGADSYQERTQAYAALSERIDEAKPDLLAGLKSPDPEIREECTQLLICYFDVLGDREVSIFKLPEQKDRLKTARTYYARAWVEIKGQSYDWAIFEGPSYYEDEVKNFATRMYFADRMSDGLSRQDALKLLQKMRGTPEKWE